LAEERLVAAVQAKTKDGRSITFECLETDPKDTRGQEKGYIVHCIRAFVDGVEAGYLKISYVPSGWLDKCFPTVWHWVNKVHGWSMNPDDPKDLWRQTHRYASRLPNSLKNSGILPWMVADKHIPDEDTIRADMKVLEEQPISGLRWKTVPQAYADFRKWHVDRPVVDFVRVYQGVSRDNPTGTDWRRQGVGTALYIAAARWLAETKGLPLHASGLQSGEATATWKAMRKDKDLPIRLRKRPWDKKRVPVLDYTRTP